MARMDSNICKFVSGVSEASLFTSNFVLETKADDKEPRVRAINRMCLAVEGTAQLKMWRCWRIIAEVSTTLKLIMAI